MKRICVLIAVIVSYAAQAQVREAKVTFAIELTGGPADGLGQAMLTNSRMAITFKNEKSLTEMSTLAYTMRTLTDSKGSLMLMDGAGDKVYTRMSKEEIEKNKPKGNLPTVVISKEKKKILGYDCTRAVVNMKNNKGQDATTIVWFTDKIQAVAVAGLINPDILNSLKGFPLEVEMQKGMLRSRMTAKEISLKPIPDATFALSTAGYHEKKTTVPQMR